MPEIIAFVSPKGGCGATSVCALLWHILSQRGLKVLALDMCMEGCTLDFMLGKENDYIYTLADVVDGSCTMDDICSGADSSFLRCCYGDEDINTDACMSLIKNSKYDYVLMDCSSKHGVLEFADRVVAVTDTSPVSVRFCEEYIQSHENSRMCLVINKIVPCLIDDLVHPNVDDIIDMVGCELLGLIPMDMYINYVPADGLASRVDGSCLYECFSNIASRIMGERVPAYDIDGFYKNGKVYKYLTKGRK